MTRKKNMFFGKKFSVLRMTMLRASSTPIGSETAEILVKPCFARNASSRTCPRGMIGDGIMRKPFAIFSSTMANTGPGDFPPLFPAATVTA